MAALKSFERSFVVVSLKCNNPIQMMPSLTLDRTEVHVLQLNQLTLQFRDTPLFLETIGQLFRAILTLSGSVRLIAFFPKKS